MDRYQHKISFKKAVWMWLTTMIQLRRLCSAEWDGKIVMNYGQVKIWMEKKSVFQGSVLTFHLKDWEHENLREDSR
jgi:hypothetical protein